MIRLLGVALAFLVSCGFTHMQANDDSISIPPLAPSSEETPVHAPDFENACSHKIQSYARERGWALDRPLVTKSSKWGLIWRIDFHIKSRNVSQSDVNRIVCWDGDEEVMISIGISEPPLY